MLDAPSLILDSRVSKLERLDVRDARIEFRGSSRDCQLTFERYCTPRMADFSEDEGPLPSIEEFFYDSVTDLEVSIGESSIEGKHMWVTYKLTYIVIFSHIWLASFKF